MPLLRRVGAFMFAVIVMGVIPAASIALNQNAVEAPERATSAEDEAWEITAAATISGIALPQNTETVCLSAEERKNPPASLTTAQCPQQTITREGETVRWVANCSGAEATGEITFKADNTLTGKVEATKAGNKVKIDLSGHKVGACTKPK